MDQQPPLSAEPTKPTLEEKMSRPPGAAAMPQVTSLDTLKSLLEKNLKWSELIYEQNKKIRRHFLWVSLYTAAKIVIVVGAVATAVIFASAWYKGLQKKYPLVFGSRAQTATSTQPFDEFLKALPLSDAQRAQVKEWVK